MRTVPLNTTALEVLGQLDDGLFTRMNQEHVSRKFAHYVVKAGLKDFKLHSLRHSFATNLISAGIDIYTVSRLLGHSDIRTSLIYAKARMDTLREAVRKLDAGVSNCYKTVTPPDPDPKLP
jgi:integrase/recombinase XerD